MVVVISNAGTGKGESWQWRTRELAREQPSWYFSRLEGPRASWISQEQLDEQRRLLPGSVYQRLWLNDWVTGGDALDGADVEAAVTQSGPMHGTEDGFDFVAGLDLGIKNDHSSLVVLGAHHDTQRIRLASCRSWAPMPGGRVDLESVKDAVLSTHQQFNLTTCRYDPYQAELMAQQLSREDVPMEELPFVGKNLNVMASTLLDAFRSGRLDLYRDDALMRDLSRLTIVQRSFGFKLEASRDAKGHADRGIALAIALPAAVELASKPKLRDLQEWLDAGFF